MTLFRILVRIRITITIAQMTSRPISPSTIHPAQEPIFISTEPLPVASTPREASTRRKMGSTRHSSTPMMITSITPRISG